MTSITGSPGRHRAVVGGSFSRSMLAAATRGLGLVTVAVILGVVLLQATDESTPPPTVVGAAGDEPTATTTTAADGEEDVGTLRPPGQVQILVLNAARIEGAAGTVTDQLAGLGHPTLEPGNAPTQPDTIAFFKPGFEAEAEAIAAEVGETAITEPLPEPSPFAGTENADVVVVLGSDFAEEGGGGGADTEAPAA